VYELVCQESRDQEQDTACHDLCGTFAEVSQPVFIDWCHLSEWGNEVIAETVATDVVKLCRAESGSATPVIRPQAAGFFIFRGQVVVAKRG
jgi:hypothetical protein